METLILVLLLFIIFINMLNSMLLIYGRIEERKSSGIGQNSSVVMLDEGKKQLENLMNYAGDDENDTI